MRGAWLSGCVSIILAAGFGISLTVAAKDVAAVSQPGSAVHASAPATIRHAGPAPAATGHTVACSGTFAKDSSHLKLAMTFDSKNIAFTDVDANGTKVPASVLFPKDPKRRLEVWWANPAARSDTYLIVINGK